MPFTALEEFRLLCSDLAAEPDARVNDFLEITAMFLNAPAFGAQFQRASVYYAGHLMLRSPDGGGGAPGSSGGGITSEKTGDESRNYGSTTAVVGGVAQTDIDLMGTAYGRLFLHIRGTRAAVAPRFISAC